MMRGGSHAGSLVSNRASSQGPRGQVKGLIPGEPYEGPDPQSIVTTLKNDLLHGLNSTSTKGLYEREQAQAREQD